MNEKHFPKTSSLISLSSIARRTEEDHTSYLKRKTNSRFTLIELLIVVAIIAILAGILLPALTSALNKSRGIHCLSGMKQLGLAAQNYLDNHNDTIIVMRKDWSKAYYLTESGYADLSSIAHGAAGLKNSVCKKDKKSLPWVPQKNVCSIIAEAQQRTTNSTLLKEVSPCSYSNSSCSGHLQYFYFYGILMGSDYTCLTDSANNYYHKTSRLRQPSGSIFWGEGDPQITKFGPLGDLSKSSAKTGFRKHADRTNVLFFDGHAGSVGIKQTICAHNPTRSTISVCESCRFWCPYYGK